MNDEGVPAANERRKTFLLVLSLVISTLLKVIWASSSIGSVDSMLFYSFASDMEKLGLRSLYQEQPLFNHTPLTAAAISAIYDVAMPHAEAGEAPIPVKERAALHLSNFAFMLRLLPIAADALIVLALLRWRRLFQNLGWPGLFLLAVSPVSLMASGFHGNIDAVMTAFLLLAVIASILGRPLVSAFLFVCACNVKIVPLPFAPLFFFFWWPRGAAWRFTATTVGLLFAGFSWALMNCPAEFLRNVFGYGSYWGNWGIPLGLRMTGWAPVQELDFLKQTATEKSIMQALKVVIVAGICFIGWRRRNQPNPALMTTFALAWLWFFVFAPGVGVQYFAWLAPFLMVASFPSYAVHTVTATAFLVAFYHTTSDGRFPWVLALPRIHEHVAWAITGGICWITLAVILAVALRSWGSRTEPPKTADGLMAATPSDAAPAAA